MKNRDMYYQNTIQGYQNPGVVIPPSGYNVNTQYQAYGQNLVPMPMQNPNMIPNNNPNIINNDYYQDTNDYENRISKLERQVKNLDTRLQILESTTVDTSENFYMI